MKRSHSFRSTCSSAGQSTGLDYMAPDSAFSNSNSTKTYTKATKPTSNGVTASYYGTRCQSTCNIVVSAVADFLPPDGYGYNMPGTITSNTSAGTGYITEEEPDPYIFNTNARCTVLPQKSFDEYSAPETPRRTVFGRVLGLVDAMCQTSDTETKYFEERDNMKQQQSSYNCPLQKQQHQRKYYDQRRATAEGLAMPEADEAHNNLPSYTASPTQTFKSASMSRLANLAGFPFMPDPNSKTGTDGQKKPRTVHIDVYCTGSEDEQADGESSSTGSELGRQYEMESNSTPKTVFDNEEMYLRHQRITGQQLPRRLDQQQQEPARAANKSNTEEEISESKQLLFRKHIGDKHAAKLQVLRQKFIRQSSEDASSYANSSRSTARDYTCSSLHSDMVDGVSRDPDHKDLGSRGVSKSDSFDYDNSLDRLRIKRMERFWSRSLGSSGYAASMEDPHQEQTTMDRTEHYQTPSHLQTISERNSSLQRFDTLSDNEQISELASNHSPLHQQHQHISSSPMDSPSVDEPYLQQNSHFLRNRPGFLQFFGPVSDVPVSAPVQTISMPPQFPAEVPVTVEQYAKTGPQRARWSSETRESTIEAQQIPVTQRWPSEVPNILNMQQSPLVARRFDMHRDSPASECSVTAPPGYTTEYLEKARKFGKVVTARKPGHHVGPTKNPTCSCESCQRWLAERFQIRARAFSLGECPVLKRPSK